MANKNYYETLGVPKNATEDQIRKAYRELAKKYHPDVSKEKDAEQKFKEIQEAYSVLSDKEKRQNYDTYGSAEGFAGQGFSGFNGQGFGGFEGFSDIFSSFFGGSRSRQRKYNSPNERMQGEDLQTHITIDFLEATLGCSKKINLTRTINCKTCSGTGAKTSSDIDICSNCHGSGYVQIQQNSLFGPIVTESPCPRCGGKGKTIKNKCITCNGNGRVKQAETIEVNIPAGVDNNMRLRVPGKGNEGYNGGQNGDLHIDFTVRPHKLFKRNENDIYIELDITFSEAALGTTRDIPTIHGDVNIKIPNGIQSGTKLRLAGKGVIQKYKKGDQYVIVKVVTPSSLNSEQKKIFQELDDKTAKEKESYIDKIRDFIKKYKK